MSQIQQDKKLKFEVPYNFDKEMIDLLRFFSIDPHLISYLYMIPFPQDYLASYRSDEYQAEVEKITREEYENHIQYIKENGYGKRLMLLLQRPNIVLNEAQLNYYLKLGFSGFCVGSIEQAKIIKNIHPRLYVLGSILMKATEEDLNTNEEYKKYFDGFVLYFPFNRNLKAIQSLPKTFNYTLLVNCACSHTCPGTPHWLYGDNSKCFRKIQKEPIWKDTSIIQPCDLLLFDQYVYSFKLQGRDYTTPQLLQEILTYFYTINYISQDKYFANGDLYETF